MFVVNEDLSIYANRGDIVFFNVSAKDGDVTYKFQPGDIVRMSVYGKKDAESVVLQKDFPVGDVCESVFVYLEEKDTKFGEIISKHADYWYEIVLNPDTAPQTIIGYDEDGAKVFRLFPESDEIEDDYDPQPEDFPVVDEELDMTSPRPVANQAIARAITTVLDVCERTNEAVANLYVTPQMFGAIADGVADDTEAILNAIASIGNGIATLHFPAGTYLVKEDIPLVANMVVEGVGHNSIVKRAGNDLENYNVFSLNGLENVTIQNLHIQGDRNEHTGTTGEWGMCIGVRGCTNVVIKDCKLTEAWGDGVYVGTHDGNHCVNTLVERCTIDNNRRQGISVINSDKLFVRNCIITNTKGTKPEAGIDFESNYDTDICKTNIVEGCVFSGNAGGSIVVGNHTVPYEITARDCTSVDRAGLLIYGTSVEGVVGGYLNVYNCNFRNETRCLVIEGKSADGLQVKIRDSELFASASNGVCVEYNSSAADTIGGLRILNCSLDNANSTYDPVRIINGKDGGTYSDIDIDVRIESDNKYRLYMSSAVTGNARVKVGKKRSFGVSFDLAQYYVFDSVEMNCNSASLRLTCKESFPYGCPVTVRKIAGTNALQIYLEAGAFPQFGGVASIELKNNFDEITLVHESSGVWSVKDNTARGIAYEA